MTLVKTTILPDYTSFIRSMGGLIASKRINTTLGEHTTPIRVSDQENEDIRSPETSITQKRAPYYAPLRKFLAQMMGYIENARGSLRNGGWR